MKNGWQEVPLKEIAKPISRSVPVEAGTEYRTIGVKWWGMGAYERETIDGSRTAAKTLSIVREGDLIINKIWVRHGSVAIAGKEVDGCAGSGEFPTFELDLNSIEPRWIHWQTKMRSFWEKCDSLSRGTSGKNRIKPELFLTIKIPLPSLNEQRRILADVDALSARIEKAQSLREEASQEANVILASAKNKLFSRGGETAVKDYATVQSGYAFKSEWFTNEGIRLVRNVNIGHGEIRWADTARIPMERQKEFPDFELKEGDVLISLDRPLISTGLKATRVTQKDLPSLLLQRVGRVIFKNSHVLPEYFYEWLNSPCFTSSIDPGRSNGIPHISPKDIEKIPFSAPPLDEQRRIVAYLDSVQARLVSLRELQSQTGEELSALLPSVLDRAFKGEL